MSTEENSSISCSFVPYYGGSYSYSYPSYLFYSYTRPYYYSSYVLSVYPIMPAVHKVRSVRTSSVGKYEDLPPLDNSTITTTTRKTRKVIDPLEENSLSRETTERRHDQRIKDGITDKLYRIEMDRVKPSADVLLQTAHFRGRPRIRTLTPEPILRPSLRAHSVDVRRYSTAGNLDIYRPNIHQYRAELERPYQSQIVEYVSSNNALVPYGWKGHEVVHKVPNNDLLSEYDLRRIAELRVKGRGADHTPNGTHLVKSSEVRYLPLVTYYPESSSPAIYRHSSAQPVNHAKRVASDGHYELDQFEKLMHRNFGAGGLNSSKTLMYTAPPYVSSYEPYVSPYAYNSRYVSRPYYGGSYSYSYPSYSYPSSYSYTRPYYYSSYVPYSSYYQRPVSAEYESIYSPPSRVTAPWGYYPRQYYGSDYYGGYYPTNRQYTYTYSY